MNPGGDAAEQVVRLSLEGVEVAAKISGNGAKNIALLLWEKVKDFLTRASTIIAAASVIVWFLARWSVSS